MSASHHRWFRSLIAAAAITAAAAGAGCAGSRSVQPEIPDQSVLDPATQALDKAVSAHADQFAPRIVDSARRRITVARDILFKAAEQNRSPTDAEHERVQSLVRQARLDAKAALVKTQAGAVENQIAKLQDNSGNQQQGSSVSTGSASGRTPGAGLGLSSFGSGNNALEGSQ